MNAEHQDVVRGFVNYYCRCGARPVFWQGRWQYPRGCARRGHPPRRVNRLNRRPLR